MRTAKKMICTLVMAALLLTVMSTSVFATEGSSAWLQVDTSEENVTIVSIIADTTVTDALISVTYDAETLSFAGLEPNADCVAYSSFNADEAGTIKLAWVSSSDYEAKGVCLFTLVFNGVSDVEISMAGQLTGSDGKTLNVGQTLYGADFTQLRKAVLLASGLDAANYTSESFAAMTAALEAAEALMDNEYALQADVDAATQALNDAVDTLELVTSTGIDQELKELNKAYLKALALDKGLYTEDSFARVEAALAVVEALLANNGTAEEMQAAADALNEAILNLELNPDAPATGNFLATPILLVLVLSAAGVVATACLLLGKKGRCAK